MPENLNWIRYDRLSSCWRLARMSIVAIVSGAAMNIFANIVLDRYSYPATPAGLSQEAQRAFDKIKSELSYQPVIGGVIVLHSPVLIRSFPDHYFLRITTAPRKRYFWLPRTWGPFHTYTGRRIVVFAIPKHGGEPIQFNDSKNILSFFQHNDVRVRTQTDAEHVRRLYLELMPWTRQMSQRHEQVSDHEWRIAIQDLNDKVAFLHVATDSGGHIRHAEFQQSPN